MKTKSKQRKYSENFLNNQNYIISRDSKKRYFFEFLSIKILSIMVNKYFLFIYYTIWFFHTFWISYSGFNFFLILTSALFIILGIISAWTFWVSTFKFDYRYLFEIKPKLFSYKHIYYNNRLTNFSIIYWILMLWSLIWSYLFLDLFSIITKINEYWNVGFIYSIIVLLFLIALYILTKLIYFRFNIKLFFIIFYPILFLLSKIYSNKYIVYKWSPINKEYLWFDILSKNTWITNNDIIINIKEDKIGKNNFVYNSLK